MRTNPDYALDGLDAVRALLQENPSATMVSFVPGRGLVASRYPFLWEDDSDDLAAVSHVGRPDEQLHELGPHELMVIVSGPNGYVSPGWYDADVAVPTWNFVVAHLHGTPEILTDEQNLKVLERLVARFENVLPDPHLMTRTLENADYSARIAQGTVGFRLPVRRIESKEKMSQDKSEAVVRRVIAALDQPGLYRNQRLAERMTAVRESAGRR